MTRHFESETWLIDRGDAVIEKRVANGEAALSDLERLVYCLWAADYMMRNAGDFENAVDLYPGFKTDAGDLARKLSLLATQEAFSLPLDQLQQQYFERFEAICNEIKAAENGLVA